MKKILFTLGLSLLILLLSACPAETKTPLGFTIDNATVSIIQGTSKTVSIALLRDSGFTQAVELSIGALPAKVSSGGFIPATVLGNTSKVKIDVGKTASIATTDIQITATAGAITKTAILQLTIAKPATITVKGKLVDPYGIAVANAKVQILGRPIVSTNAQGQFLITNVKTPYDLIAINPRASMAVMYQGLRRSDPRITAFSFVAAKFKLTKIKGKVDGGIGYPEPAPYRSKIALESPDKLLTLTSTFSTIHPQTGVYAQTLVWLNKIPKVNIHALQWKDNSGVPSHFSGYGKKPGIDLIAGGNIENVNITMAAVTEATFTAKIEIPNGYSLNNNKMSINFGGNAEIEIANNKSGNLNLFYITPQINGASLTARAYALNKAGDVISKRLINNLAVDSVGAKISLAQGSELKLPLDKQTLVDNSTAFSWTQFKNGIHAVFFENADNKINFVILTKNTTATIPDLSAFGITLPKDQQYSWHVVGLAPYASMDQVANTTNPFAIYIEEFTEFRGAPSGAMSDTDPREFKTAP